MTDFATVASVVADFAEALTRHQPLPGGIVVITDANGVLLQLPFGCSDLAVGSPVTESHLFEIGSISKMFTSFLANQLIDEGRISLDTRITSILPWVDVGPHTSQVTIGRLLNHTAGLIMGADALADEAAQVWSLRDRAAASVDSHFHYSNLGYQLVGLALAEIEGDSVPNLLQRKLFAPMGMSTALGALTNADRGSLAVGHSPAVNDRPWLPGDPLAPATWFEVAAADSNVAASAADIAQLLRLLLGNGDLDGRQIFSQAALGRIRTYQAPTGEKVVDSIAGLKVTDSRYGLGINVELIAGHECLTHGGGMVGYASFVLSDRFSGVGVGVLTNADGDCPGAQVLARFAHRAVLAAMAGEQIPQAPEADLTVTSTADLPGLAGTKASGEAVAVSISAADGDGAPVTLAHGGITGRVWRTWTGGYLTDHPELRLYPLHARPESAGVVGPQAEAEAERLQCYVGHYRSYSPWFTNFRIVVRDGALLLVAPGGVEAPAEEQVLVELEPGVFRIGAAEWLPERLTVVAEVGGQVILLDRDGCGYSRTFTA